MPPNDEPGPAVDAAGRQVIDPTKNVLDLVEAAIRRQDDLRTAESRHIREIASLRAHFGAELRKAESDRIDKIRAVDVGNVERAAQVQAAQAQVLANTVAASAEANRNQVAAAAQAAATAQATALNPIIKRIEDLSRAQYEAAGQKTQVVETQQRGASSGLWIGIAIAGVSAMVAMLALITAAIAVVVLITQ